MGTSSGFYSATTQAGNKKPVAAINPSEQTGVLGSVIRVDGRASYDPESSDLTYTWSLAEVPIGSSLTDDSFDDEVEDGSIATFVPDRVGMYRVTLVVNDGQLDSAPAESFVLVSVVSSPVCSDIIPDASFMFNWTTDFLRMLENRDALPIFWSALVQIWGAQFLRLLQYDRSKSIRGIQELFQGRWLHFDPLLALDPAKHRIIVGNQQDGSSAVTGRAGVSGRAIILSDTELHFVGGAVNRSFVGQSLSILDSNGTSPGNNGTYTITRTLPNLRGYRVSASIPIPDVLSDTLSIGSDMVTTAGSNIIESPSSDFSVPVGLDAGDILRIEGVYYEIDAIGMAGGLASDGHIQLTKAVSKSFSAAHFEIYNVVSVLIDSPEGQYTDSFYVSRSEADFTDLNSGEVVGYGTIPSRREFIVGPEKTYESAVGKVLTLSGDEDTGEYVIGSVNESRDGYYVVDSFSGSFPRDDVPFSIDEVGSAEGRVAVVGDRAVTLSRVFNSDQPEPPNGPGEISVAVCDEAVLLSGQTSVPWRIPGTLISEEVNFEDQGVSPGDLLIGEAYVPSTGQTARIGVTVVGADRNRLGFEVTRQDFGVGDVIDLTDSEKVLLAGRLGIDGASLDMDGNLQLSGDAQDLSDTYNSGSFESQYFNVPLHEESEIDVGPVIVNLRVFGIFRNSRVPVPDDLRSAPCLSEYVVKPATFVDEGETTKLLTKDDALVGLTNLPVKLVENREFTIQGDSDIVGRDGVVVGGDRSFESATGDFLNRRVRTGDTLVLEQGFSAGDYLVLEVVSSTELSLASKIDGDPPPNSDENVVWSLRRRNEGNFIHFVPDLFSAAYPAPPRLWSEVSFFNNVDLVEDNFGRLVQLRQRDLSDNELRSASYLSSVRGLMYAFSMGSKLRPLEIGAALLLGLPIAEERGIVRLVQDDYQVDEGGTPSMGRMVVEDLDERTDEGLGLLRVYFYRPSTSDTDPYFAGRATHPETGAAIEEGDILDRYQALSNSAKVEDYVEDPDWWVGGVEDEPGQAELQKFHRWAVLVDADTTRMEDLGAVQSFVQAIKPKWTEVKLAAVKFIVDEISVEDSLSIEGHLQLTDHPGLGLESTIMWGEHRQGVPMLQQDGASRSTRTLFRGHDLVTTSGSDLVSSARGGFVLDLEEPPGPLFSSIPDTGEYTSRYLVRGSTALHPGDVLYILDGPNEGRYEVVQVDSNKELRIRQLGVAPSTLPPMLPVSPALSALETAEGQAFIIERAVKYPICAAEGVVDVSAASAEALLPLSTGVISSGAAVGDRLAILGASEPPFKIMDLVLDTPAGYVTMILDRAADVAISGGDAVIFRDVFLANPLCAGTVAAYASPVVDTGEDVWRWGVLPGDWFRAGSHSYRILDIDGSSVTIQDAPATLSGDWSIERSIMGDTPLTHGKVSEVLPREVLHVTLYAPKGATGVSVVDLYGNGGRMVSSVGTDFGAAGVIPGEYIDVGNPGLPSDTASGVFRIQAVSGHDLELEHEVGPSFTGEGGTLLGDSSDFQVNGDQVTSASGINFELLRVRPGDLVVLQPSPGGTESTYRVLSVVGGTITLTRNTGLAAVSRYGRIDRTKEF